MDSGRHRPGLFRCETLDGDPAGDYVVKLRGSLDAGNLAFAFEGLASMLARHLGLQSPQPAVVRVGAELAVAAEQTDRESARLLSKSEGLNFGSEYLAGVRTWGADEPIPSELRGSALEVLAFDALIENPDRRRGNPNLLVGSSEIHLIDHEMAFSFCLDVLGPPAEPWKVAGAPLLREHVFYRRLRRDSGSLERFQTSLAAISDAELDEMIESLPPEWQDTRLATVKDQLRKVRDHADTFVEQVKGALR